MLQVCTIELSKGLIARVDPEDFDRLAQFPWHAVKAYRTGTLYAFRWSRKEEERIPGKKCAIPMHEEVLGRVPGMRIDHVRPELTLDNRRCNLRRATASQNAANAPAPKNNTSGFKGVAWHSETGEWRAYIRVGGKQIHLGLYASKEDAAKAYDRAAIMYFGEFAYLNFPKDMENRLTPHQVNKQRGGIPAKLNRDLVLKIRELRKQQVVFTEIARQIGVCKTTIRGVCNGTIWSNIQ